MHLLKSLLCNTILLLFCKPKFLKLFFNFLARSGGFETFWKSRKWSYFRVAFKRSYLRLLLKVLKLLKLLRVCFVTAFLSRFPSIIPVFEFSWGKTYFFGKIKEKTFYKHIQSSLCITTTWGTKFLWSL